MASKMTRNKKIENKKTKSKKLWFKAKCYGWGWYPSTWQGGLVTLLSIWIFIIFWTKIMRGEDVLINSIIIILDFIALLVICYRTGEKPRWRWGK